MQQTNLLQSKGCILKEESCLFPTQMSFNKLYVLALASVGLAVAVPTEASQVPTTFTGSFESSFESPFVSALTDSGTISYTLEAEDLDGDGILDPHDLSSELFSLMLVSENFSTPDLNFNLSFERGDSLEIFNTITDVINPIFDFNSEQLFTILTTQQLGIDPVQVLVVDELDVIAQTGGLSGIDSGIVGIGFDFDGSGTIEAEESVIAPTSVPEPSTILGCITILGVLLKLAPRKFLEQKS
ncbi:MAG: hypothetical protein AAFZ17_01140 [Cyanobacteria bacterium J06650_10]